MFHLLYVFCKVLWLKLLASLLLEGGKLVVTAQRALKCHIQLNTDGCLGTHFLETFFFFIVHV